MKHVLVTGGGGFIASHLIDTLLKMGCLVRVLVHRDPTRLSRAGNLEVVGGDIRDKRVTEASTQGIDTVFHAAGKVHDVSNLRQVAKEHWAVNVDGTKNMLDGSSAAGVSRFVLFSSVKCMGEGGSACLDETATPQPETPYGHSKLEAERLTLKEGARADMHVACLRLPLVYGPGERGNLGRMITAIDRGVFPPLPEFGNRRSVAHVANVVDAAILVATRTEANGQVYIVTDCQAYSTRELYELIASALGKTIPRWRVPIGVLRLTAYLGDVMGWIRRKRWIVDSDSLEKLMSSAWYSPDKITKELGFRPALTFEQALPQLIDWYRKSKA